MSTQGKHVATATIEEAWKLGGREHIPAFLRSMGINPVVETAFGRGTMRLYDHSVLDLRPQFQKYLNDMRNNAPGPSVRERVIAKNLRIEEQLASIDKKLDAIHAFLERLV
jgi:hypothetical protein